jgi:dienelactone hydrolase
MDLTRRQFELRLATLVAGCGASSALAQQTPRAREVPWLAEVQRPPAVLPRDAPRLNPLLVDFENKPIATLAAWQRRREEIRENWLQFIGTWDAPRRTPEYQILESDRVGSVSRRLITYQSERNVAAEAYLLTPRWTAGRVPGVVIFHSTVGYTIRQVAGVEGPPEAHWGLRLAERGMVVICPRCFLWDGGPGSGPAEFAARAHEHQSRHPNTRGMGKMLYDARRAVDLLTGLEEVDMRRIGAAGHSLGAKQALYLAALDPRIRAAVSSEGGIGVGFSNWDAPWYLGTRPVAHDHHELLSLVAPRAFLVIGGGSADGAKTWPFINAALDVYRLYGQPCHLGLFNHGRGHAIPPEAEARTYEWLATYL